MLIILAHSMITYICILLKVCQEMNFIMGVGFVVVTVFLLEHINVFVKVVDN